MANVGVVQSGAEYPSILYCSGPQLSCGLHVGSESLCSVVRKFIMRLSECKMCSDCSKPSAYSNVVTCLYLLFMEFHGLLHLYFVRWS